MAINSKKKGKWFCCEYCQKQFWVRQCDINYRPTIKYCSSECYHKASRKTYLIKCENCNKEFEAAPKHKDNKYCSLECFYEHRRNRERKATIGRRGYRYIWFTDGSSMPEHRYIMEKHLGRKLNPNEHVHHKDFSRDNNNIENLMVVTRGEHSKIHRKYEMEHGKRLFGRTNEQ